MKSLNVIRQRKDVEKQNFPWCCALRSTHLGMLQLCNWRSPEEGRHSALFEFLECLSDEVCQRKQ